MLAGIEIDTNGFKIKTTEKTYEAAAYLTSLGADSVIIQELQQESKDDYFKMQRVIEKSEMINKNTILCSLDNNPVDKKTLAKIAEELLKFEDVDASYVIGYLNEEIIGVSARSLGNIEFGCMQKLGGGGHLSNAAAQLTNTTIDKVKEKIINLIMEHRMKVIFIKDLMVKVKGDIKEVKDGYGMNFD